MPIFSATTPARLQSALPVAGCAWLLGLSVFPLSSTRIEVWPWAGVATLGWLAVIGLALVPALLGRPASRFGGAIDAGLLLLAGAAVASALLSPLRGVLLPRLPAVLGACALPYVVRPWIGRDETGRFRNIADSALTLLLLASLALWLPSWNGFSGGEVRNAQPFGHANITGSVAVLAAAWFAVSAARTHGGARGLRIAAAVLAALTAFSSGSRGAVLALAAGLAAAVAVVLLRRGRLLVFILVAFAIVSTAGLSNARLRDLMFHGRWSADARESNAQRTAMIRGGVELGLQRPLLGWGAGAVPHVFPRVRAETPGTADNFLQLHNTPAQLWATLGLAGLLAAATLAAGLLARLRRAEWTPAQTASFAGLAAALVMMLFDHAFATPAFTALAAGLLAVFSVVFPATPPRPAPRAARAALAGVAVIAAGPVVWFSALDLAARSAHADALGATGPDGYSAALRRAARLAPADPYYDHLLAARLATGHPFPPDAHPSAQAEAIVLLERTLAENADLEYARYNLGWLLLDQNPREAAGHFAAAARLAPQRGAVYLGLGLARLRLDDTGGAVRAFATEWLLSPGNAWSPVWFEPPLAPLRPRIHALAAAFASPRNQGVDPWTKLAGEPAAVASAYRRLRTGYGVLMGHPEGPPPVDVNVQFALQLPEGVSPPPFGWIDGRALLDFLAAR